MEQSKTEPLKEQCHESEDFVHLVIKKSISPGQNHILKRTSEEQWSSHHLHLSFSSKDIG